MLVLALNKYSLLGSLLHSSKARSLGHIGKSHFLPDRIFSALYSLSVIIGLIFDNYQFAALQHSECLVEKFLAAFRRVDIILVIFFKQPAKAYIGTAAYFSTKKGISAAEKRARSAAPWFIIKRLSLYVYHFLICFMHFTIREFTIREYSPPGWNFLTQCPHTSLSLPFLKKTRYLARTGRRRCESSILQVATPPSSSG